MLSRVRQLWDCAPVFWKTYIISMVFVGGIVLVGEGIENILGSFLAGDRALSDLEETNIWIVATLVPTALGAYLLTRFFLRPLEHFSIATAELAEGHFQARLSPEDARRGDELGVLARAFNHMAERVQRAFENERGLLAAISHELRSPLTRLSLTVALLRRQSHDTLSETYLQRLELEAERMNALIAQLLDYARRETQEQQMKLVDLCEIIQGVSTDAVFEGMASNKNVQTSLPKMAELHGNSTLLRRAVDNVVRNSLQYSPENGVVHIALSAAQPGGYTLTVRDHGPGVPEFMLGDIFRPFFRVDSARTRTSGGTGMGLCLVEQAVRLHGGSVRAENAPDGGLQVTITLPGICHAA